MFKRIMDYLRGLVFGTLDKWEDPGVIIDQAVREMKENQAKNRERAVQAIAMKNQLANMVDKEEKISRDLEAKATFALQNGNRELARTLLKEKSTRDSSLDNLRASYKQAEETAEAVKRAIQNEEERIRVKTADALRLKANMKQAQIQNEINKALDGFQFGDSTANFDRAEERIQGLQAEADARSEIAKTSVNARLAQMEEMQVDVEADKALADLEKKLGMAPQVQPNTTVVPQAQESDIDRQLRELEQKLNQQG